MSALLAQLEWRASGWFWLALTPWLAWALQALRARRRGQDYAAPHLLPWARAITAAGQAWTSRLLALWRPFTHALGWLLMAAAMAGPRVAETLHDRDRDAAPTLFVLLDVSRSMTATDIEPNRLQRALLELDDLFTRADRLRIGLIAYGARPHLMLPPTADRTLLRHTLHRLRPGLLPTEGSDPAAAIHLALSHFADDGAARALLLIGDGELTAETAAARAEWEAAVAAVAARGISLNVLGVGSVEGAPLRDARGEWLRVGEQPVISRLAAERLAAAARVTAGRYAEVAATDAEWRILYDDHLRHLAGDARDGEGQPLIEWRELYVWFLLPAVVLLLIGQIEWRQRAHGLSLAVAALLFGAVVSAPPAQAQTQTLADNADLLRQAHAAYVAGDLAAAQRGYARVGGYDGRLGEGISAYRAGDFPAALHAFSEAVLAADDDAARARAVFNLGNVRYRMADYALAADLYRESLRYAPADPAARVNLEWAEFRLVYQQAKDRAGEYADLDADATGRGRGARGGADGLAAFGDDLTVSEGEGSSRDRPAADAPNVATAPPAMAAIDPLGTQPVVARDSAFEDDDWVYAPTAPDRIVREANALAVDQSRLWQRLFETEEGFPAALDTPRPLPGRSPW